MAVDISCLDILIGQRKLHMVNFDKRWRNKILEVLRQSLWIYYVKRGKELNPVYHILYDDENVLVFILFLFRLCPHLIGYRDYSQLWVQGSLTAGLWGLYELSAKELNTAWAICKAKAKTTNYCSGPTMEYLEYEDKILQRLFLG